MPRERPDDFVLRTTARIAEVRRSRDMTQEALAERLGIALRNVQRIEAGQNLTLRKIARIAMALDVSPEVFFRAAPARQYATPLVEHRALHEAPHAKRRPRAKPRPRA